jgi:hypothetical protein
MFKGKMAVLTLAVALLVVGSTAFAGIIDPCNSTAVITLTTAPGTPVTLPACPSGDADRPIDLGWYLSVSMKDGLGNGIENIPPTDFWAQDCNSTEEWIVLCGGSASWGADSLTNALGNTTFSNGRMSAGVRTGDIGHPSGDGAKCSDGIILICQGEILQDPAQSCAANLCLDVSVRSYDLDGDLIVALTDLANFSFAWPGGSATPNDCIDYNGSGLMDLPDLANFSLHFFEGNCAGP